MAQETGWIPETIGQPVDILFWTTEEIVIPAILLGLAVFVNFIFSVLLIVVYFFLLKRFRDRIPKKILANLRYMAGVSVKGYPSFFAKRLEE